MDEIEFVINILKSNEVNDKENKSQYKENNFHIPLIDKSKNSVNLNKIAPKRNETPNKFEKLNLPFINYNTTNKTKPTHKHPHPKHSINRSESIQSKDIIK